MRRFGTVTAAALVLAANLLALLGVAANRRGEPDAELTLTERELPTGYATEENSGIDLVLRWSAWSPASDGEEHALSWGYGSPAWFDQSKLEAIGFDCSKPLDDADAALWYGKKLPLERYAVLEYEGRSWDSWIASQEEAIAKLRDDVARNLEPQRALDAREARFAAERRGGSRLFLVDVGSDPGALREQHPDRSRYIIAPALARLHYGRHHENGGKPGGEPFLRGRVSDLLGISIHVPRRHRAVLDAVREEDRLAAERRASERGAAEGEPIHYTRYGGLHPPRYRVTLRYGTRHEPWITGIARIEPEAP